MRERAASSRDFPIPAALVDRGNELAATTRDRAHFQPVSQRTQSRRHLMQGEDGSRHWTLHSCPLSIALRLRSPLLPRRGKILTTRVTCHHAANANTTDLHVLPHASLLVEPLICHRGSVDSNTRCNDFHAPSRGDADAQTPGFPAEDIQAPNSRCAASAAAHQRPSA